MPIPTTSRELRLVVIGDSTAEMTSVGIANWTLAHPGRLQIDSLATPGCGFLREGHVPTDLDTGWDDNCTRALDDELPATIAALQPDVVMLMVTMRDVEDRIFPGIPTPISPLDQRFAVKLLDAYESMAEQLLAAGIGHLAWVIAPPPISDFQGTQVKMLDRHRYEVQWDIIRQVAAQHPDEISVLDADAWLRAVGEDRSADVRVDGLHWSESAAVWVSDQFFVGSLIDAVLS